MIAKPIQDTPENLLESIDTFHGMVSRALQTEYPGMALRTSARLHDELVRAAKAMSLARQILDNVITSR
jgi:hypothetical protein